MLIFISVPAFKERTPGCLYRTRKHFSIYCELILYGEIDFLKNTQTFEMFQVLSL